MLVELHPPACRIAPACSRLRIGSAAQCSQLGYTDVDSIRKDPDLGMLRDTMPVPCLAAGYQAWLQDTAYSFRVPSMRDTNLRC